MRVRFDLTLVRVIVLLITSGMFAACTPPVGQHPPTPGFRPTTTHIERITLENARQTAGFHVLEPSYIPDVLNLESVMRVDESIDLEYRGTSATGQVFLSVIEKPTPMPLGVPTLVATPDTHMETVPIRGIVALVSRNFPNPIDLDQKASMGQNVSLTWTEAGLGLVLEGNVNFNELVRIANSMK